MNKENHHEYTLLAIELYEKYKKKPLVLPNASSFLPQGAWDEDKYNVFTFDLQRIMNWHFYNNKNSISNRIIPAQRISEKRVHKLTRKVLKEKKRYWNSRDKIEKKG